MFLQRIHRQVYLYLATVTAQLGPPLKVVPVYLRQTQWFTGTTTDLAQLVGLPRKATVFGKPHLLGGFTPLVF